MLHSVAKLAQRDCDPHEEHIQAVKRIFRYLRGTVNFKIKYEAHSKLIEDSLMQIGAVKILTANRIWDLYTS